MSDTSATTDTMPVVERPWFNKLLILTAAATWGFSFVVMKDLVDRVPVFWLLAVRYALASVVMLLVFRRRVIVLLRSRRATRLGIVLGLLLFGAYAFQTMGLAYTTPGKNSFLTGCYCVMVPFIAWAMGQGRPRVHHLAAAVLCVGGIGLVALGGVSALNIGDWLTLVGAACYALQFVCLARWGDGVDALAVTSLEFVIMALCSMATTLLFERGACIPALGAADWGAMAFLVLVCSCFDYAALNWGIVHVPPAQGSILSALEAPFGVFAGVLFYGELLTLQMVVGFALIFCATLVSELCARE